MNHLALHRHQSDHGIYEPKLRAKKVEHVQHRTAATLDGTGGPLGGLGREDEEAILGEGRLVPLSGERQTRPLIDCIIGHGNEHHSRNYLCGENDERHSHHVRRWQMCVLLLVIHVRKPTVC